ncbi:pesticin C-terminus-like muramidase [Vibrio sinaloensis]|uniref:pesticin C-terminus-like muramidase n=1 Tax=Photobacterium sp. (strain ATCC 43367) TaxID=379097 RepID=UPI0022B07129|nr:pesticin C-terminus-like muramidase [Vibrio sinaloensis]MCZ4293415.1 pesticin C-terminus-like muramidase [Vibrio sinaloensis]
MKESQAKRTKTSLAVYDERERRRLKQQASLSKNNCPKISNTPILKSRLLKNEKNMNALGCGSFSYLSFGMKSFEVLKTQEALKEVNVYQGKVNGHFGSQTKQAIKKFQKEYHPTHTTHKYYQFGEVDGVVGKNTILALDEAINEGWKYLDDAMDEKWLMVPRGQFTFDCEGDDIESSSYFTRKAHVPQNGGVVIGQSGVTIGRGLDLGNSPTGATGQSPAKLDLNALFQEAELIPELSDWLLSVEGVKRASALESLHNSGLSDDELTITRKQQHLLFNVVYEYMEEKTRILLTKPDVKKAYGDVGWDELPLKVKDVLIDLTYRGDNHGFSRKVFVPALVLDKDLKDYSSFYNAMKSLDNIPEERLKLRLKWLN